MGGSAHRGALCVWECRVTQVPASAELQPWVFFPALLSQGAALEWTLRTGKQVLHPGEGGAQSLEGPGGLWGRWDWASRQECKGAEHSLGLCLLFWEFVATPWWRKGRNLCLQRGGCGSGHECVLDSPEGCRNLDARASLCPVRQSSGAGTQASATFLFSLHLFLWCQGLNPGPCAYDASRAPLSGTVPFSHQRLKL